MKPIQYYLIDYWDHDCDHRISHLPLMNGGPWIAWSLIAFYLYFIRNLGPKLMKNRRPFDLRSIMVPYNIFMAMANVYFFYEIMAEYRFGVDMNIWNFEHDHYHQLISPKILKICLLSYLFLLLKYLDLIPTIIFVLRKKYGQISNLHVYNHSITPILIHMYVKISPAGGPAVMYPLLNTFIQIGKCFTGHLSLICWTNSNQLLTFELLQNHTPVIYVYYTLSALGLGQFQSWLKPYITRLQAVQFVILTLYGCMFTVYQKGYPPLFTIVAIIQPVIFVALFLSTHRKVYRNLLNRESTIAILNVLI